MGLVLEEKGRILRNHQKIITSEGEGEITSGSYSPTLGSSIAFARIPYAHNENYCDVIMGTKQFRHASLNLPLYEKEKKLLFKKLILKSDYHEKTTRIIKIYSNS